MDDAPSGQCGKIDVAAIVQAQVPIAHRIIGRTRPRAAQHYCHGSRHGRDQVDQFGD